MPEFINAKGLGCAQPVLLAKSALELHAEVIIDVDARMPLENIAALAMHNGYAMDVSEKPGNIYSIRLIKNGRGTTGPLETSWKEQENTFTAGPSVASAAAHAA